MQTRRNFIGNVATGLAGSIATGSALGANSRVRLGIIGTGDRGMQLAREILACPNTELAAFADIYNRRLEEARTLAPTAKTFGEYQALLEDNSLDAVIIATPQHLHAEHFSAALDAGKHVYQEKSMAFTVEHAKLMRAAYQRCAGKRVVQIGHQVCSSGQAVDAAKYLSSGELGQVTAINARMFRNTPHGKPQWARPVYPDMTPDNLHWRAFLGNAPERPFDPHRYANWRYFWDYSGGNVHENLSHQLAFWYKAMRLEIPASASMTGGIYLWKDGREVPDTMSVSFDHGDLLFSWQSGFGNSQPGTGEDVLGSEGTVARGQQIRYIPQKVNRPGTVEVLGETPTAPQAHMRNFLDAIRDGREPNCPFEIGYRVSVACHMAVESYLQQRPIQWDATLEELV
jgi:predicted dehydrogenase